MVNKNQKIINDLKVKSIKPLYLVHGTEPYYIDLFTDKLNEIVIPEAEKAFNEYLLYGKDVSMGDVINYARKFPMMAERQLIIVKEAHAITDILQKDSLLLLENYAKNPLVSTCLVLSFGKEQDQRKSWVKSIQKHGEIISFNKMYDSEIPEFITELCHEKGLKISPKAIQLLAEHLGNNLQAIENELEKIKLNLKEGEGIDAEIIERFVGISKDFNFFELQKTLIDKNTSKAYQIVNYFAKNSKENPLPANIILLYNFFSKVLLLHGVNKLPDTELANLLGVKPFFLRDYKRAAQVFSFPHLRLIIQAIREIEIKSKGIDAGNASEGDLYKELIFKILV